MAHSALAEAGLRTCHRPVAPFGPSRHPGHFETGIWCSRALTCHQGGPHRLHAFCSRCAHLCIRTVSVGFHVDDPGHPNIVNDLLNQHRCSIVKPNWSFGGLLTQKYKNCSISKLSNKLYGDALSISPFKSTPQQRNPQYPSMPFESTFAGSSDSPIDPVAAWYAVSAFSASLSKPVLRMPGSHISRLLDLSLSRGTLSSRASSIRLCPPTSTLSPLADFPVFTSRKYRRTHHVHQELHRTSSTLTKPPTKRQFFSLKPLPHHSTLPVTK